MGRALCLCCLLAVVMPSKAETLTFTEFDYIGRFGNPKQHVWYQVVQQALENLGYEFNVRFEPGNRAIHHVLSGKSAGLLLQAVWLQEQFPSLVRVEQQLAEIPIVLYRPQPIEQGFSLSCDVSIGIANGYDGLLRRLDEQLGCDGRLLQGKEMAVHFRRLVMMLQTKRLDWLMAPVVVLDYLESHSGKPLYPSPEGQQLVQLYMYLSKDHEGLAPRMAVELRRELDRRGIDFQSYTPLLSDPSLSQSPRGSPAGQDVRQ